jgi:hypothetical protein
MANILDLFAYRNISRSLEAVKTGIPDLLPPQFNTITEKVFGNETTWHQFYGQRKLVQRTEYASPAKHYGQNPIGQKSIVLTAFKGFVSVQQELILRLRQVGDFMAQEQAKDFIARKTTEFKQRFDNNRVAHQTQMLAKGIYWYDGTGNLLPTSSGMVRSVDMGVPAGNKGQVSGIINAAWSDPAANIMGHIEQMKQKAIRATGRPLKHAFYGLSIPGWIYANNSFKYYFQHNPTFLTAFANNPTVIPDGFQGLTWHKMSDAFYEKEDGTVVPLWDDDAVTFTPEIDADVYTLFEGSEIVPTGMGVQTGDTINLDNTQLVHGRHAYSIMTVDPITIKLVMGDNMMPVWKLPNDIIQADVAP